VALDLGQRAAHRRRHAREAGFRARFRVHRIDLGHHARALRPEVLTFGFQGNQKQGCRYCARLSFSISA
jgi:hypothetical protein